ncbi:hypothetical protein MBLNU459_g4232t2 [Dothideomycetes sp. NU459]
MREIDAAPRRMRHGGRRSAGSEVVADRTQQARARGRGIGRRPRAAEKVTTAAASGFLGWPAQTSESKFQEAAEPLAPGQATSALLSGRTRVSLCVSSTARSVLLPTPATRISHAACTQALLRPCSVPGHPPPPPLLPPTTTTAAADHDDCSDPDHDRDLHSTTLARAFLDAPPLLPVSAGGKNRNANQHDKRHESGLAAPGKRITKQRSNPTLNGTANGRTLPSSTPSPPPPPPLPSTGLNQGLTFPRPANNSRSASTETAPAQPGEDQCGEEDRQRKPSRVSVDDDDDDDEDEDDDDSSTVPAPLPAMAVNNVLVSEPSSASASSSAYTARDQHPRRVSEAPAYRSIASSATSTLALAATILSSCPLRDAIAILILLLSLPPTLIITIHTLFASLTFVTPAGISWNTLSSSMSSFSNFSEWFHATQAGGPSLFTMFISDALMIIVYLCSPLSLRNVWLDFGQSVIAISLSGAAAAGKGGSAHGVAVCAIIVLLSHVLRFYRLHVTGLEYLRSALNSLGTGITWTPPPTSTFSPSTLVQNGWPRTLLGCHILAQGLVILIRRSVQSYANHARASASKTQDAEAAPNGEGRATTPASDGCSDPTTTSSSDGRPPGQPPALRDGKEKVSSNKKKKKQANEVRIRQPLWAAIASTKVTFLKEVESKKASNDASEVISTNTTEKEKASLSSFQTAEDRIWVLEIRPTEICFRADLPSFPSEECSLKTKPAASISAGIDKTKPFYVRMNGADWGSTKITGAAHGDADGHDKKVWLGEIFGLSPLTNYSCEFVSLSDQQVICTTSLVTLPAPSAEQASVVPAPPQHQSLRPLSPISTLKQSIAAAEMKRDESRNKLKRTRKDHKNAASALRKEIEQLNGKVASSGGQDDRQRQRILQLTQHLRQANDATVALKKETDELGEIPDDDIAESTEKKRVWQETSDRKAAALADLDNAKTEAQRELGQINSELGSSAQKRERLMTRRSKLNEQLDRLRMQKDADMSARQKHDQDRVHRVHEYQRNEAQMLYWIQQTNKDAEEHNIRANEAFQQMDYLNSMIHHQHTSLSGPPTPEGNLPGTNGPQHRQATGFEFPMFGGGIPVNQGPTQGFRGGRGRSSSMLSGYSGFTDDLDALPVADEDHDGKKSEGSSGSNGSQGDYMSPRPKTMSAIGPRSTFVGVEDKGRGKLGSIGNLRY